MSNIANKFLKRTFRRISGTAWDVLSGAVGLKTDDGIYTYVAGHAGQAATETSPGVPAVAGGVSVNPLDAFSISLPAFAVATPRADVAVGDLLVGDTKILGWVEAVNEASYTLKDHNGYSKTYSPPKVQILGQEEGTVMVVKNLFSLTGGADGANNLAGNLLPLLMLGKGDGDLEKLLPVLLMTGGLGGGLAGGAAGLNPMVMMMLMKDGGIGGGGMSELLPILALSGGLGGAAGANPLGNPLVMMMMLKSKSGGGSFEDLLPLLMMSGGAGGVAQNPMLMAALLGGADMFGGKGLFDAEPEALPIKSSAPALKPALQPTKPSLRPLF